MFTPALLFKMTKLHHAFSYLIISHIGIFLFYISAFDNALIVF